MRTKVTIEAVYGGWMLFIDTLDEYDEVVEPSRFYHFTRLIEAINAASAMKLHIDNIDELPIHQYSRAS